MSINGVQNTSFPLTLSGLTLTDDLSGTYVPYAGAISAIDLNNKAVSNVASLAVVGAVSGATVTATGAVSGATVTATGAVSGATVTASGALSSNTLTVTNNTATGSLTSFPTTYPVANIKINTTTTIFVVMIPYPASFTAGTTVQIYNFNTLPAFNRQYTITSVDAGSSLFYANYTSGLTVGDRYYTSTARAYISNGTGSVSCMSLSSQISASLANLTATGDNAISNLTTTGSLISGGPVICNNTTAIGYWLPSNGTTSIYITDTSANVSTPATTLGRYFGVGGAMYQDFYGSFNWRATTGLNSALTTTVMSLTNTTLTVSANLNVTGTSNVLTPATNNNSTNVATTAFVNNFAIPIAGLCTGVNTTLRLLNALTTAVFRIASHDGVNIFQVYYTSGVPEVICSSLQVSTSGEFRAYGNCNLGATTCTTLTASSNVGITGTFNQTGTFTQTGQQTFNLGAYGSSGDYIVPPTNIYGSTVFDGFSGVNIQNQASQYGRNILFLTGRYEASNDAWSWNSPRNAIIFRTQSSLNSSATLRYTIQNYFNELGIMSAGKASVPITKWANDGTMTHTDNMIIGGDFTCTKVSAAIQFANQATFAAKNSGGTYENFLWPRWSDNIMYLNYGSGGFHIRNNASTTAMFITNACNVGIGHTSPICALDVVGIANIWTGGRGAVSGGYMSAGSLTIGSTTQTYGGTNNWSANTAGLMMETNMDTEICCHHANNSVNSLLYYEGNTRRIHIGAGMGWGENPIMCEGTIYAISNTTTSARSTYGQLYISNGYNNNSIIHRHDGSNYYMLISNGAYDTIWNGLRPFYINISTGKLTSENGQEFRGNTYVGGTLSVNNGDNSYGLYGPNSTWNSYIYVGASTSRITQGGTNSCQVITTNGNLHLDSGYNRDIYLNYYNKNAVTGSTGAIYMYGETVAVPNIPGQNYFTANIVALGSSSELRYAQFQTIHFEARGAWGGGVSLGSFSKGSGNSAVVISGDASYYVSSGGNTAIVFRMYNTSTGQYFYRYYDQYTNNLYNHRSFPFNHFVANNVAPAGTYDVYMYLLNGSYITDGNDYVNLNITVHP